MCLHNYLESIVSATGVASVAAILRQVRKLKIKKVDDKPMVIHTKEKTKIHVKAQPETKIKGRNVLVVEKKPKIAGAGNEEQADKRKSAMKVRPDQIKKDGHTQKGKISAKENVRKSVQKEAGMYAQYQKSKVDREKASGKKTGTIKTAAGIGAMTALEQMDGGNEVYDSYQVARTLSAPAISAAEAGKRLYRTQAAKAKAERIKKVQAGRKIGKKTVKESASKSAKHTAKTVAKETVKKAAKEGTKAATKAAVDAAAATAGTAVAPGVGTAVGVAAGYAAGVSIDYKDMKTTNRNRKIKFFLDKMNAEEQQKDSFAKLVKDLVLRRAGMMIKAATPIVGLLLLVLVLLVAVVAIPVIAVIAVIYNSPFAIFFPSISFGETTQAVLSAYVAEFNRDINDELTNHPGYDTSEKIYVDFEGAGTPDNYYDILAVYMVKYGVGDTATDMTDKAKQNLKSVFDDMCSYSKSSRTDTETDDEGNTTATKVKEVRVVLKTYRDMISEYGFDSNEQELLEELMKPEYLAMLGYTGGGGDPGEGIRPEQYQAIVDSISDANGKQVVSFVLSKVGYPYSQANRDSGDYYDCSSLAYYAWKSAGVNIMYEGANTAAAEGKYCYDNNYLVNYDEMQPGDLIFYSYGNNGRFYNITHVAVYVGDGKVVEAANERLGVVYRPVQSKSSIVFIGRPR